MKERKFLFCVFFLMVFLFLSCARKPPEIDLSKVDVNELLQRVAEVQGKVKSLKGLAYVNIKTPDRSVSFNQVTVVQEPDLLRIEALAPFGRTAGVVISNGEEVYVIFPQEYAVFSSLDEFDLSLLYPELPLTVSIDDLVNLFLGRVPQRIYLDKGIKTKLSVDSGYLVLTLSKNGRNDVIWVNPLTYRIEKAKLNLNGGVLGVLRFKRFKEFAKGVLSPQELELKTEGFRIHVIYEDTFEVNGNVDRELFNPKPYLVRFEKRN